MQRNVLTRVVWLTKKRNEKRNDKIRAINICFFRGLSRGCFHSVFHFVFLCFSFEFGVVGHTGTSQATHARQHTPRNTQTQRKTHKAHRGDGKQHHSTTRHKKTPRKKNVVHQLHIQNRAHNITHTPLPHLFVVFSLISFSCLLHLYFLASLTPRERSRPQN